LPRAASDAEAIYRTVMEESPVKGQAWFNGLIDSLYSLERQPQRCRVIHDLSEPGSVVRLLLYGRKRHTYRVYFDIVEDTVRILHIRYGGRRAAARRGGQNYSNDVT
jgi:plasmid stabilization system protein ParE